MPRKKKNNLPPVRRFEVGASLHNETFLLSLGYKISKTVRYILIETKNKKYKVNKENFYAFVDKIRIKHGYEPIIKPKS